MMNFWERLKLKIIADSWEEYGHLKYAKINRERLDNYSPPLSQQIKGITSFKHSGNSGDIIYSLPLVKEVCQGVKANVYLHLDQPANYGSHFKHPLGRVMLNKKMVEMLTPLLLAQEYIQSCQPFSNEKIDIDLDMVRQAPIPFARISLPRWYFLVFGKNYDLSKPWLNVAPDGSTNKSILIARSNRYQGHKIDYSFLSRYPDVQFVGVKQEFEDMKQVIPNIVFRPVKDFLEMASLIAGAKLFIGNQSFPFSIAEGLKTNRILEVSTISPDVAVNGSGAHEFYFQEHFERLVSEVYD